MTSAKSVSVPVDNYAKFLTRLEDAAVTLVKRRDFSNQKMEITSLMFKRNEVGHQLWRERKSKVNDLLDGHSGNPAQYRSLTELHDNASRMERLFRERVERLQERLTTIRGRRNALDQSLLNLETSKAKLNLSKMLSQERESLNRALADLAGTMEGTVGAPPASGLAKDLRDAREAVALSEALVEIKGH